MTGILVLDVGTTALKAVHFSPDGSVLAAAEAGYGPAPGPHRQDPEAWIAAAAAAVGRLGPVRPEAIGLTGTMENLIPVDGEGRALSPALLYSDPCGTEPLARHADRLAALNAAHILGNAPEPLMSAFKRLWLADHAPDVEARAATFLFSAKDYLALRFTGVAAADPVTASTSGLMDMRARAWSPALMGALGVDPARLPALRPAGAILGPLTAPAAAALGLPAGVPVVNGLGDAGATTVGSGADGEGTVSLYLGTTGWVARVVPETGLGEPRPVYRLAHPAPSLVIEVTPILTAGAAAAWARAALGIDAAAGEGLLADADAAPPDLVFLPYLAGERSPFVDADVRGAFLGLDASHGPAALYHAVLEGVAFAIAQNLAALDDRADLAILLAGGGATSRGWPPLLADVLGRPVGVPPDPDLATARGAFAVTAAAIGRPIDVRASATIIAPRPGRRDRIDRLRRVFDAGTAFARGLGRLGAAG